MEHLLVPIAIEAFVANRQNEKEKWTSDVLPDFTALSDTILGSNIQKEPFSIQEPLKQGVHLHFILPDALTHGTEQDGCIQYPDIPDRWLVVRIIKDVQKPAFELESWLIESDYTGLEETPVPVPRLDDTEQPYCYLGRCYKLGEQPEEGKYLGGLKVSGPGDPTFAAYYPSCRGVLGFHDSLEGVPCGTLSYFAAGWYGSGNDPFASLDLSAWQEKLEEFSWKTVGMPELDETGHVRSPILCHGMVCGIEWKGPDAQYEDGRPKGHVDVTIGDTSAEALSALMASRLEGKDPQDMEFLLNALQLDCLELAGEIDGKQKIRDIIHAARFSDDRDEIQWKLSADQATQPLSDEIRFLFHTLSECQEEKNQWLRDYAAFQQRLYDTWYTYFLLYEDPYFLPVGEGPAREEIYSLFQSLSVHLDEEQKRGQEISRKQEAAKDALEAALSGEYRAYHIESVPARSYKQCSSPVLLFSGDGLKRGFVYGEDGRFDSENKLVCRLSGDGLQSLEIPVKESGPEGTAVIGTQVLLPYCTGTSLPEAAQELVCESILLDPSSAETLAAVSYQVLGLPCEKKDREELAERIRKIQTMPWCGLVCQDLETQELKEQKKNVQDLAVECGFTGTFPSKAAVNFYKPSMNTLFLEWKVLFYPTKTDSGKDNSMDGWSFRDTDYEYDGMAAVQPVMYMGRTVVTPHSQRIFQDSLKRQAKQCMDEPLRKVLEQAAEYLENLCLLSQSLDGLNQKLAGRRHSLQFPYMIRSEDLSEDKMAVAMTAAARKYLQDFPAVPILDSGHFFPIRSGFLKIQEIQLVGSFGQRQVITADFDSVSSTSDMKPPAEVHADAVLKPRISQGGRVCVDWLCADETSPSPVCGFVMPDWMNYGLMVYDAGGRRLGNVQLVWRNEKSYCRWQPAPSVEERGKTEEEVFTNTHLKYFVRSLLRTREGVFADFLHYIDERQSKTVPESMSHSKEESLFCGRPVALVRAGISMSLKGLAEYKKGIAQFGAFDSAHFEEAEFQAAIGDVSRSHEGCLGCFFGTDMEQMYDKMYSCGHLLRLKHDGIPAKLSILMEPACAVTIYTGAYPAVYARLPEEFYQEAYGRMYKSFSIYPLLGTQEGIRLPAAEEECRQWTLLCPQPEGNYTQIGIQPDMEAFTEENLLIIEGHLVSKEA